jgi:cytochrome b
MNTASVFPANTQAMPQAPSPSRRVTDAPIRVFHALFALSFTGAYLTGDSERWRLMHLTLGYTLAGLLVFRLLWGIFGPRQARLSLLTHKLAGWSLWFQGLRQGQPSMRHGQNLLMASAGAALLLLVVPLSLSGYAIYDDWDEWLGHGSDTGLETAHALVANAMVLILGLHLGLIALLSWLRGPHQAGTMLSGRIPGHGPDLVKNNHNLVASALFCSVLTFWSWQWQGTPQDLDKAVASRLLPKVNPKLPCPTPCSRPAV